MNKPRILLTLSKDRSLNYVRAFAAAGFIPTFKNDSADALLLCGGGDVSPCLYGKRNYCCRNVDLERDQKELYLIKKFLDGSRPIFAVCRGLQVVNVFFGGSLCQDLPFHDQINGVDRYHDVKFFGELKKLFGPCGTVNSAHHQAIAELGKGLKVTAVSEDGGIEGVETELISAYQFHPERLRYGACRGEKIIDNFYKKYFG